ncbi:cytochrome P450 [Modestobacter sp. I12A-02628]|uniref:Cytochrome P450 n=1 Tax=Goekera deserti TaxID=2497753 RepID=A0A7K3WG74_9ACTN|nr:cytochrome P450 [Goekera deserti]MPQ96492.1 cytochrome P450 [Goekera deserti]NDI47193.1 cytochrome P450 [Goekera deserti]NEL55407.1 cytochrome P450 [Goekera deserti]
MSADVHAAPTLDVDRCLTDPQFFAGMQFHDLFRRLRAEDPVHWTVGDYERPYWSLTRYDDCVALMSDSTLFSNLAGPHLPPKGRDLTPEEHRMFGTNTHILMSDPPDHGRRRRPMNKHFSVPVVTRLRPMFSEIVTDLLDAAEAKGDFDIVADIAAPLPVKVILRLLGVQEEDWAAVQQMAVNALHSQDAEFQVDGHDELTAVVTYIDQVYQYVLGLILDRRATPADDYATILAQLRDGDELFTEREAAFMAVGFVLGGLEGTRNAVSVGLMELMAHPEQARALAADPALTSGTVEEVLRWTTPSKNRLRVATADTELGGKQIRAGDWVVGWIASANRDEAVFDRPDDFDITRTPNKHLSFGHGDHTCIGRAMARLELEILFPAFVQRFGDLQTRGEPEWLVSDNATGLKRYPVRVGV